MSLRARWIALVFAAFAFAGCKARVDDAGSQVKFGYLQGINQRNLVYVPDGGEVRICGANLDDLAWAINVWAAAIGRTLSVVKTCTNQHVNVWGKDEDYSKSQCEQYNLVGREYTQHTKQPMEVVDCGGLTKNLMLHEAGHLFGLCDQYAGQIEKCKYSTAAVEGSVMRNAVTDYLTQDDISGIKALADLYSPSAPAGKKLTSGYYDRAGGGFKLWVGATNDSSRTTAISLMMNGQTWTYTCDQTGTCSKPPVYIKITGPQSFDYTWNGTTAMSPAPGANLADAEPDVNATQPGDDGHPPAPPPPENFSTGNGNAQCSVGLTACDAVGATKSACVCNYYDKCVGIESAELCTGV